MQPLSYISLYARRPARARPGVHSLSINLVTNFTDEVLERIFGGVCLAENIYPRITRSPYKQYVLALKDKKSTINRSKSDISYIFFDANPYRHSEFMDPVHREEVLADIEAYSISAKGIVVVSLCVLPYHGPHGHFFREDPLFIALSEFNARVQALAEKNPTLHVFDTNKIVHLVGEIQARDLRGQYAFDMPFTTDFLTLLASHWFSYARALLGRSRKCIVLDLDNTLWGGVLGEEGPLGIALGAEYPGLAYQSFQRALLSLWERGIILAINSKNNGTDVDEVFEKNPHMILKKEHIAALRANWNEKSENIKSLAKELNIGLDSMVFIDDSPLERERMREEVPQVLTPEWKQEPEHYVKDLFSLTVFHQLSFTTEDKKKGEMYAQENKRKEVQQTSHTVKEYLAKLAISIRVFEGSAIDVARAAQLTQKTNQYNLTTRRYSEDDIRRMIQKGDAIFAGDVTDRFGGYGVTILAIIDFEGKEATLNTFLMSCRVMGREVENAFFEHIVKKLHERGVQTLHASYVRTSKNEPVAKFLPAQGMKPVGGIRKNGNQEYALAIGPYVKKLAARKNKPTIVINQ